MPLDESGRPGRSPRGRPVPPDATARPVTADGYGGHGGGRPAGSGEQGRDGVGAWSRPVHRTQGLPPERDARAASSTERPPSAADRRVEAEQPLLAGGTPPPRRHEDRDDEPGASPGGPGGTSPTGIPPGGNGRHRRGAAGKDASVTGEGRRRHGGTGNGAPAGATAGAGERPGRAKKARRKGSFWRELPLLIVVAVVLTFVIQTFVARIYVIPSASMEQTLHGCTGCTNDRVAVDKVTYRFSDPSPGDVVVFKGPPAWSDNDEVASDDEDESSNVLVRGFDSALGLLGFGSAGERDFVKRVIATGGQTVTCCDAQNHVTVDGRPLTEPYIYYQPDRGAPQQEPFPPVTVPQGQLWVMGDNRNNSADARVHGPIGVTDVIGKARVIVLPVDRWSGVPDPDPQATPSALGVPGWANAAPVGAGLLLAVPTTRLLRRRRIDGDADGDDDGGGPGGGR